MTSDDDDDALTWAGGSDPSHVETPEPVTPPRAKALREDRGRADENPGETADLPPVTSAAVLLSLGVLAGVYLLYTIGWIVSLRRFVYFANDGLDGFAFSVEQLLAIAAPALWFGVALYFTRHSTAQVRLVWLGIGAILLVPWSFVLGS